MKRPCKHCHQLIEASEYEKHMNHHRNTAVGKRDLSWANKDWQRIRRRVLERDGYTCQRCRATKARLKLRGEHLQVHHIVPAARGGSDAMTNLVTLCPTCHGDALEGRYGPRADGM